MATRATFTLTGKSRDAYLALVRAFPLASIRSEEHLRAAQEVMDRLLALGDLDHGQETYLDALSDLAAAYEDAHHRIDPATDADLLRHFLEARGVTQAELSRETDLPRSSISEVLAGKKLFTRVMIRKLADYFGVEGGVLAANFGR
jgi:HTH-type transcriptional regulator/antitoxin HigA